jgi:hypothetical protein
MPRSSMNRTALLLNTSLSAAYAPPARAEEPMRGDLVQDLHWQDHHFVMTNRFYH